MAAAPGKRAWRRWDEVEERLLASGVKTYGTKAWEKVQQHMCTDRTTKQLSDHWVDRQEQCKELLERLGPAPRSVHESLLGCIYLPYPVLMPVRRVLARCPSTARKLRY